MNSYYALLNTLKEVFLQDSRVHTVTTGADADVDNYRKNIYPLVHINIFDSPFVDSTAVVRYNVEITVVDVRDVNSEVVNDKFWYNDNRHDNWNETRAILKLAENKFIKDINDTNITIDSATNAVLLSFAKENTLDGWQQTWTIDVPDTNTKVCCE